MLFKKLFYKYNKNIYGSLITGIIIFSSSLVLTSQYHDFSQNNSSLNSNMQTRTPNIGYPVEMEKIYPLDSFSNPFDWLDIDFVKSNKVQSLNFTEPSKTPIAGGDFSNMKILQNLPSQTSDKVTYPLDNFWSSNFSNIPELNSPDINLSQAGNFLQFVQQNSVLDLTNIDAPLYPSNQNIIGNILTTTEKAPPWNDDLLPGESIIVDSKHRYQNWNGTADRKSTFSISKNNPLIYNVGVKYDNSFWKYDNSTEPPTLVNGGISKTEHFSYPLAYRFQNETTTNVSAVVPTLSYDQFSADLGLNIDKNENFSFISGIWDKSLETVDNYQTRWYVPDASTSITNFSEKNISADNKILPSTYVENFKELFDKNNFNLIGANFLPSTWTGTSIKLTANDLTGIVNFKLIPGAGIEVKKYKNKNNYFEFQKPPTSEELKKFEFSKAGFNSIKQTTIEKRELVETKVMYAQDGILDQNNLKQYIYDDAMGGSVPTTFNYLNDIIFDNITFSNKKGEIYLDISLRNFFDKKNEIVTTPTGFGRITISNYTKITSATTLAIEKLTIDNRNLTISEWYKKDEQVIIDFLKSKEVIDSIPNNDTPWEILDLNIINKPAPMIQVTISLSQWFYYDKIKDDYFLETKSPSQFGPITIEGFRNISPTILEQPLGGFVTPNNSIYAFEFPETDIKNFIFPFVKNTPNNFSIKNIIINSLIYNNFTGVIEFNLLLNNYFDKNYELQLNSNSFIPIPVTIKNFIIAPGETTINNIIKPANQSNVSPSTIAESQIINFLLSDVNNKPPGMNSTNFIIEKNIPSNIEGKIHIEGKINLFFNKEGVLFKPSDKKFKTFSTDIIGFAVSSFTALKTNLYNSNEPLISPSSYEPYLIKKILKDNIISNFPKNANLNNIFFENDKGEENYITNNLNGDISISVTLNSWYDEKGVIHNEKKYFGEIKIIGFKSNKQTIIPTVGWQNVGANNIASDFATPSARNDLISLISPRIENTPTNFNPISDIIFTTPEGETTEDITFNNLEGTIDVYIKLRNYFDEFGDLQITPNPKTQHIKLGGFIKLKKTTIDEKYNIRDSTNILATINYKTNAEIKKLFSENLKWFSNAIPKNFDPINDLRVEAKIIDGKPNPNNLTGEITVIYWINHYYNSEGLLISSDKNPLVGEIILTGFKIVKPTEISSEVALPLQYLNQIASLLDEIKILEIINSNKNLFFKNFLNSVDGGLTVKQITIVNNSLNLNGELLIDLVVTNFYDEKGNISNEDLKKSNILIKGFKKIKPTVFFPSLEIKNGSKLLPSDLKSDSKPLEKLLSSSENLNSFLNFYPNNFSSNDFNSIEIIYANNITGEIKANISIINYFNVDGNLESNIPLVSKNPITITGFANTVPTSFSAFLVVNQEKILASEFNSGQIRDLIMENIRDITSNLPKDFQRNDIKTVTKELVNNLTGQLKIKIKIINYIDQFGILQLVNQKEWEITIKGFRTIVPTQIKDEYTEKDFENKFASTFTNDSLKQLFQNIQQDIFFSLPDNFNIDEDLKIVSKVANNLIGVLTVEIKISNYYDDKGDLIYNQAYFQKDATIKLTGFKSTPATYLVNDFKVSNPESEISASEFNTSNLANYIFTNRENIIKNLPSDFKFNDITNISIIEVNNKLGYIKAQVSIKNYYSQNNSIIEKEIPLISEIMFSGFKSISPTSVVSEFDVSLDSTINVGFTTNQNERSLRQSVKLYYKSIFKSVPSSFTKDDVLSVKIKSKNNLDGSIAITVIAKNTFDENSQINNNQTLFDMVITGFEKIKPTTISDTLEVVGYDQYIASDLKPNGDPSGNPPGIIKILYDNLQKWVNYLPGDFAQANIFINEINHDDNKEGKLNLVVSISNYYDDLGNLELNNSTPKNLVVSGFNTEFKITTMIKNEIKIPNQSDVLAQDISNNTNKIKDFIFAERDSIFRDLAPNFIYSDFDILQVNFDNIKGILKVNFWISNYYDINGVLQSNKNKKQNYSITLTGFKEILPTTLNPSLSLNFPNILASSIVDIQQIKNIIWINKNLVFKSLPSLFDLSDFDIEIISSNNLDGILKVNIILKKYFDSVGNLEYYNTLSKLVEITGFKSIKQTTWSKKISVSFPPNSDKSIYIPSEISSLDIKKLIVYNKDIIFNNIPDNFGINDIININKNSFNNLTGELDITFIFGNFYDHDGSINLTPNKKAQILLTNFFKQKPTTIKENLFISQVSSIMASSLTIEYLDKILNNKYKDILFEYSLPSNTNINIRDIKQVNNITGEITVYLSIDKYFNNNAELINETKFFTIKLNGFMQINDLTTINGNYINTNNNDLTLNISNLFISASSINNRNDANKYIDELISPTLIIHQGISSIEDIPVPKPLLQNWKYIKNSANDFLGTIQATVQLSNFWDNEFGIFHNEQITLSLTISGFQKSTVDLSSSKFITYYFLIGLAAFILIILIVLLIAKAPKLFSRRKI